MTTISLTDAKKEIKKIIGVELRIRTVKYSEFGSIFITDKAGIRINCAIL